VKAAAFPDLPVHPGRPRVVHLEAVHPEVGNPGRGVAREDERQREERARRLPARWSGRGAGRDARRS
jgi:hypothetical protein